MIMNRSASTSDLFVAGLLVLCLGVLFCGCGTLQALADEEPCPGVVVELQGLRLCISGDRSSLEALAVAQAEAMAEAVPAPPASARAAAEVAIEPRCYDPRLPGSRVPARAQVVRQSDPPSPSQPLGRTVRVTRTTPDPWQAVGAPYSTRNIVPSEAWARWLGHCRGEFCPPGLDHTWTLLGLSEAAHGVWRPALECLSALDPAWFRAPGCPAGTPITELERLVGAASFDRVLFLRASQLCGVRRPLCYDAALCQSDLGCQRSAAWPRGEIRMMPWDIIGGGDVPVCGVGDPPPPPPLPTGACCAASAAGCAITSEAQCRGTWRGAGSTCPDACPTPAPPAREIYALGILSPLPPGCREIRREPLSTASTGRLDLIILDPATCGVAGPPGQAGPRGAAGERGPAGPQGPPRECDCEPPPPPPSTCPPETCREISGVVHAPQPGSDVRRIELVPEGSYRGVRLRYTLVVGPWRGERHNGHWLARGRNFTLFSYLMLSRAGQHTIAIYRGGWGIPQEQKWKVTGELPALSPGDRVEVLVEYRSRPGDNDARLTLMVGSHVLALSHPADAPETITGPVTIDLGFEAGANLQEPPSYGWRWEDLRVEVVR